MKPFNHVAAPTIDYGVESRLARLDRRLHVTWSPYVLDSLTGQPIESKPHTDPQLGRLPGGPVPEPMFYLWLRCDDGKTRLVTMYKSFGHAQVAALEGDLFRRFSAPELARKFLDTMATQKERQQTAFRDVQSQKVRANRKRINDLIFEGKGERRQARSYSGAGMKNRSTPGDIAMDAKEAGWELPERE